MIDIYCHTNRFNGKRYVGYASKGVAHRWYRHVSAARKGCPTDFAEAIRSLGPEAFDHEVICQCETEDEAKVLERHYIEMLNTWGGLHGYNMTRGGNGNGGATKGQKRTEDFRIRTGDRQRGRQRSPETCRKIGDAHRGVRHTEEARKKMGRPGRKLTPEQRMKITIAQTGKKRTKAAP